MSAGVEPRVAAAELGNLKLLELKVSPIDVGDLKLATSRGAQVCGHVEHFVVVEIKSSDRPIRQEVGRLLDDVDDVLVSVELEHAILARLVDIIGKYGG